MKLEYLQIDFKIKFSEQIKADVTPLFILRSMLGKNLRSMCCISKQSVCPECMYNKSCVYAYIFETILPQENTLLPGTNRASHPYSFASDIQGRIFSEYSFKVTLLGKAIEFFPYIYASIVRTGKDGLFKSRTKFDVVDVIVDGKSIFIDENTIRTDTLPYEWFSGSCAGSTKKEILVELKSPLRFKTKGKYTHDFSAQDFMKCLYRRARTLCGLYGSLDDDIEYYEPDVNLQITDKNVRWVDYNHYSARQKNAMELGGAVGKFKMSGSFTDFELSLFEINKIANAGKNTNFGLGQIDFWVR